MTDSNPNFSDWVTADVICKENPHIWKPWALKAESMAREQNGMAAAGACMMFRHKLLFHRERLAEWWEKRYLGAA